MPPRAHVRPEHLDVEIVTYEEGLQELQVIGTGEVGERLKRGVLLEEALGSVFVFRILWRGLWISFDDGE